VAARDYFRLGRFTQTRRHAEVWSRYEKIYTGLDFVAALSFLVGSVLFYYEALHVSATTLFVIGSAFFAAKPTVRLLREFHLSRLPLPGDDMCGEVVKKD
jgi:hypothetical protein